MTPEDQRHYDDRLRCGEHYQTVVADALKRDWDIDMHFTTTEKDQLAVGESLEGIEVKFDAVSARTPNLWIETHERRDPHHGPLVPSGIFRTDNTTLYAIGNFTTLWVLAKDMLQLLDKDPKLTHRHNDTGSSRAFLLPKTLADDIAEIVPINLPTPPWIEKITGKDAYRDRKRASA